MNPNLRRTLIYADLVAIVCTVVAIFVYGI